MAADIYSVRRTLVAPFQAVLTLLVVAALTSGCSQQSSAARLSDDSPLFVATSQTALTIENRAGLALTDIAITIAQSGPLQFSARLARLENLEKRDIPVSQFRSRDGTTFNARFHKAKSVSVRSKDTAGKAYEVEIPWN